MSHIYLIQWTWNVLLIIILYGNISIHTQYLSPPSFHPAPPRIILEPPSSDGTYTVEAGGNFVLTCEVDPFSYPGPVLPISVFRVVGNMTELLPGEYS